MINLQEVYDGQKASVPRIAVQVLSPIVSSSQSYF